MKKTLVGEQNNSAKLTEEDVLEIVRLRVEHNPTYLDLAMKYDIHPSSVYNIIKGRTWNYLTNVKSNR